MHSYFILTQTYGSNKQVADSAATATALLCGVKANWYTFGVDDSVLKNNCTAQHGHEVKSILHYSQEEGKGYNILQTHSFTNLSLCAHNFNRLTFRALLLIC